MDDELIEHVLHLIDAKKGDNGRLNYILSMLQEDRPLYISDRKYLESLISMYVEPSKRKVVRQQSVEELKTELTQVKQRLERYEKRGYKRAIGRKSVFFFVTFFFGWHAIIQLLAGTDLVNNQNINPYLLPIYQLKMVIPSQATTIMGQYGLSLEQIVVFAWSLMMLTWIILGFVYLVKFMRSRYNPALQ